MNITVTNDKKSRKFVILPLGQSFTTYKTSIKDVYTKLNQEEAIKIDNHYEIRRFGQDTEVYPVDIEYIGIKF